MNDRPSTRSLPSDRPSGRSLTRSEPPVTPAQLREIGLFGALPDDILEHLCETLKTVRAAPGDAIFREGDAGRELFVVLEGEMEVTKKSRRGRDTRVAIFGPCDAFGEMSIIDMQPRSATVRALGPARLLRVSSEDMDALYRHDLKAYTLIVLNIAREMSRRLRVTDGLLADFTSTLVEEYVGGKPQSK
ncbi:MAG: cyclic nucleotide-binding domain-containing protein [Myxococcales bacterium]|jgi:CRP/FNR family cyclic AMP-dependent transcriptional regulator|nr:cyclic nucleotide-binding domain-containing protein [Myxococcales bacterium]